MLGFHRFFPPIRRTNRIARNPAIVFALFSSLFLWAGCHTSTPPDSRSPSLRVGTSGDYVPFSVATDGSAHTGFSIDVARAYAQDTGRRLELVPFRWPALRSSLERGEFDFALSGVTVRPDRSTAGRFSHPLTESGAVVLVSTADPAASRADLDRPDRTLAVNAGGHLERTARRLFPNATVEAIPDNRAVLSRLGRDGVTGVVTDSLEAPHWLERRAGLRVIGPLTRDRKAAWFPRDATAEAARFDAWLMAAEGDGRLAAMRARHGLPEVATARPAAALAARIDERLSLMVDVARTKWIRDVPVEDRPREARVLDAAVAGVGRAAARLGRPAPPADAVRAFYAAQIEAAKGIQRRWLDTRTQPPDSSPLAREAAGERLDRAIRPALIALGDRIAELLVQSIAAREPAPDQGTLERALSRHALSAAEIEALATSLARLLGVDLPNGAQ